MQKQILEIDIQIGYTKDRLSILRLLKRKNDLLRLVKQMRMVG